MWWKMEKERNKNEPSFIAMCIWAKVWKREEASSSFNIKQVEQ